MKKDHSKVEIEISQKEFDLSEKVANILQMFCEATKLLSKEDCSISNSIPIVTTIVTQLSSKSAADWGVKTLKSGLLDSVKTRFAEMESEKHYTVSTCLVFSDIFVQTNPRGVVPSLVQT